MTAFIRKRNQLDEIALFSVSATYAFPSEKRRLKVAHVRRMTNEKHSRDTVNWIKRVGYAPCWHETLHWHRYAYFRISTGRVRQ